MVLAGEARSSCLDGLGGQLGGCGRLPDNGANGVNTYWVVYEQVYNAPGSGNPPAATDTWVFADAAAANKLWSTYDGGGSYKTLADWKTILAGYDVYGIAAYAGSGWLNGTQNGTFIGAVDNVSFGFTGASPNNYNFEVQGAAVPEPSSIALMAIAGGLGLAGVARRRLARG
jgi:hypothetical protein